MRVGAHAALVARRKFRELPSKATAFVKQLGGTVAFHPVFENAYVVWILVHLPHRHLVRAPETLGSAAVYFLGAGPAFRAAQDDHRPPRAFGHAVTKLFLDASDFADDGLQRRRHKLVHLFRLVTLDEIRVVPIA